MKFLRIQTVLDIQDPANPRDLLMGRRDTFDFPAYSITREGDSVRIAHLASSVLVPWSMVRWAVEDTATENLEDTDLGTPKAKRKVSK